MQFIPRELKKTADISRGKITLSNTAKTILGLVIFIIFSYASLIIFFSTVIYFAGDFIELKVQEITTKQNILPKSHTTKLKEANKIFDKLCKNINVESKLKYKLRYQKSKVPNAYATVGGYIFITSGLLNLKLSEESLAFVIAHEIMHHKEKHILKFIGFRITNALILNILTDDTYALNSLLSNQYSQSNETEADKLAIKLVLTTYPNKKNYLEFFEKIKNHEKESVEFLQSHPITNKRIIYLKDIIAKQKRF